jgi:DNA-directed RNA polymerase subunit L
MDMNILRESKEELEIEFPDITIAEILRVYLNKDSSVEFAAWKREHPTEKPKLLVKTKGKTASKAVKDAISAIDKELSKFSSEFKKMIH